MCWKGNKQRGTMVVQGKWSVFCPSLDPQYNPQIPNHIHSCSKKNEEVKSRLCLFVGLFVFKLCVLSTWMERARIFYSLKLQNTNSNRNNNKPLKTWQNKLQYRAADLVHFASSTGVASMLRDLKKDTTFFYLYGGIIITIFITHDDVILILLDCTFFALLQAAWPLIFGQWNCILRTWIFCRVTVVQSVFSLELCFPTAKNKTKHTNSLKCS